MARRVNAAARAFRAGQPLGVLVPSRRDGSIRHSMVYRLGNVGGAS